MSDRELKSCPFCGGDVGESSDFCGPIKGTLASVWWCTKEVYDPHHTPSAIIAVAKALAEVIEWPDCKSIPQEQKSGILLRAEAALSDPDIQQMLKGK